MLPVLYAMDRRVAKVIEGGFEGGGDLEWIEQQVVRRGDDADEGHNMVAVHRIEIIQASQQLDSGPGNTQLFFGFPQDGGPQVGIVRHQSRRRERRSPRRDAPGVPCAW